MQCYRCGISTQMIKPYTYGRKASTFRVGWLNSDLKPVLDQNITDYREIS